MDKIRGVLFGDQSAKESTGAESKQEHTRNDSAIGAGEFQAKDNSESRDQDDTIDTGKPSEQKDPEQPQDTSAGPKDETTGGLPETGLKEDDSQTESKEPSSGIVDSTEPQQQPEADKPSDVGQNENEGDRPEEVKDAGITETQPDLLDSAKDGQPSIEEAQTGAAENAPTHDNEGATGGQNEPETLAESKEEDREEETAKDQKEGDIQDDGTAGVQGAAAEPLSERDPLSENKDQVEDSAQSASEAKPDLKEDEKPYAALEGEEQTSKPSEMETLPSEDLQDKPTEQSEPTQAALGEQPEISKDETPQDDGGEKTFSQEGGQNGAELESGEKGVEEAGLHKTDPELLEASATEQPSADDARAKAEENAPEVGGSTDAQAGGVQLGTDEPQIGEQQQGDEESKGAVESSKPADPIDSNDAQSAPKLEGSNIKSGGGDKPEAGPGNADEVKDAGLPETQPSLLEASQTEQPSAVDAGVKAEENVPAVEGLSEQQGGSDKPDISEPSNEPAPTDLQQQDESLAESKEPHGTESQGDSIPGVDQSGGEGLTKTGDSGPEAVDSGKDLVSNETATSGPDSGNVEPKSMLDAGESAPAPPDSGVDTQSGLPDRSTAGDVEGGPTSSKVDSPVADEQVDSSGGVTVKDDVEEEDDDDAEGSGKKEKFTEKVKRKVKEVVHH